VDRTAEKLIVNPITYHGDCYVASHTIIVGTLPYAPLFRYLPNEHLWWLPILYGMGTYMGVDNICIIAYSFYATHKEGYERMGVYAIRRDI